MSLPAAMLVAGLAVLTLASAKNSCIAFGKDGFGERDNCESLSGFASIPLTQAYNGTVSWATEVPGVGLALCDTANNVIKMWTGDGKFVDISLGMLLHPSGAVFFDGLLYVACFGAGDLAVTSGLAIINPFKAQLVSAHAFLDEMHIHNAYAMDWDGQTEIFVAVLGNPWASPPLTGRGLVRFDRNAGTFIEDTTAVAMNVRAAKQQSDGAIYTLSQEPNGEPSLLSRLVKRGSHFVVDAQVKLPKRNGGSGGADVVLGKHSDTMFASDRTSAAGKLYFYVFADGVFQLKSTYDTGKNPRYTTVLDNGDVVICNQDDATLSVFDELASHPTQSVKMTTLTTVHTVMFFVKRSALDTNASQLLLV